MIKSLAQAGSHNLDWQFSVLFTKKTDGRDLRPMNYTGFSAAVEPSKTHFWSCNLRKDQFVTCEQSCSKTMREVENMSEDALPATTDDRMASAGASKYWQIGPSACENVLDAILTGQASTPATLLIDLFTRTGEFAEAFMKQRKNRSHTFFLGFCESQTEATYVESVLRSTLAEGYLAGGPMPAGDFIPSKVPEDILEAMPAAPAMNLLVAELKITVSSKYPK